MLVNLSELGNGFLETFFISLLYPPMSNPLVPGSLIGRGLPYRKRSDKCFCIKHPTAFASQHKLGFCVTFASPQTLFHQNVFHTGLIVSYFLLHLHPRLVLQKKDT